MSTYAVIESGGKQYRVEKGTTVLVDRLGAEQGEKVTLRPVLFRDEGVVAEPKELEKVEVEATVAEHLRGPKLRIFKYKAKKGQRRRAGHRSELTRLEVTELSMSGRKAAAKPKAEAKPRKSAKAKSEAKGKKPAKAKTAKTTTAKGKAKAESQGKAKAKAEPKAKAAGKPKAAAKKPAAKKPAAKKPTGKKSTARKSTAKRKDSDDGS